MTIGLIKDWVTLKFRAGVRVDDTHAHFAGEDIGRETTADRRMREAQEKYEASPKYKAALAAAEKQQGEMKAAYAKSLAEYDRTGDSSGWSQGPLDTEEGRLEEVRRLHALVVSAKRGRNTGLRSVNSAAGKAHYLRGLAEGSSNPEIKRLADEAAAHARGLSEDRARRRR